MASQSEYRTKRIIWALLIFIAIIAASYIVFLLLQQVSPVGLTPPAEMTGRDQATMEPGQFSQTEKSAPMGEAVTGIEPVPDGGGVPGIEQKLIKTADVSIKVKTDTFEDAFDRAAAIAEASGGYVTSSSSSATDEKLRSGTLTIRVPSDQFTVTVDRLRKIGEVQNVNVGSNDVTEEYVDLEARLKSLKSQEELLLGFMDKAKNVDESINVERRLSEIQQQIEQLTGRKNYLDNRIDYATISVYLFEPSIEETKLDWGFIEALRQSVAAFVRTLNGMIIVIGSLGPIIVIGLLVWAVIARRRSSRDIT